MNLFHARPFWLGLGLFFSISLVDRAAEPEVRTPKAPLSPRINGPAIFAARPGSPFLYHVPATGDRPMGFFASGLPAGLKLDTRAGEITGSVTQPGEYQ